jgi:SEC-C motif-containing protein
MAKKAELCPCGSQASFKSCCEPLIKGTSKAETAEQLMRSRYAAYTKGAMHYLFETTHPDHRKGYDHDGTKEWAENSDWQGLEIISTRGGSAEESLGEVEFTAKYAGEAGEHIHHEIGRFRKSDGIWYFTDGKMAGQMPIHAEKIGRNDPCRCGSGKKYKKCCGA